MLESYLAIAVVILSIVFTYTNGLQDGSSVTATVISCRAMSPRNAVLLVALAELVGALTCGSSVARSVMGITDMPFDGHILPVLSAGLISAIAWNWGAKLLNFPSSSTHALFGGLIGALVSASGTEHLVWGQWHILHPTGIAKIVISLFLTPALGFLTGYLMLGTIMLLLVKATNEVNKWLRLAQMLTVGLLGFGHGSNAPQKAMGIILIALQAAGLSTSNEIPVWVRLVCGLAIALGVVSLAQGIVKRVGSIYRMRNIHGFVTESAASLVVVVSSHIGNPVSTSQVIASTVMGVGTGERVKDVHWLVARDILVSWLLTMPLSGAAAWLLYQAAFRWMNF